MKRLSIALLISVTLCLSGCTLIGLALGSKVDDELNEDKYASKYMGIGLETDIIIVKEMLSPKAEPEKDVYTGICKDDSEVNICSQAKGGCWCEKRQPGKEDNPKQI